MKKFILPIIFLLIVSVSCKKNEKKTVQTDVVFSNYVQAFTSGMVSKQATISVYLAQSVEYKKDVEGLFRFIPEIKGKTVMVGDRMFEFRPSEPLKSGVSYKAEFALGKVIAVDSKLSKMPFEFSTVKQTFSVTVEGLKNYEGVQAKDMQLNGYVLTADVAEAVPVEKILTATYEDRELPVTWNHDNDGRKHFFVVDSIPRKQDISGKVLVNWDGNSFGVDVEGNKELEVPAINSFKILDATVVQQPEQCIHIRFSDPLLKVQDLDGLVELENTEGLKLEVDENLLKVWTTQRVSGELTLNVSEGIKSNNYARLKKGDSFL